MTNGISRSYNSIYRNQPLKPTDKQESINKDDKKKSQDQEEDNQEEENKKDNINEENQNNKTTLSDVHGQPIGFHIQKLYKKIPFSDR